MPSCSREAEEGMVVATESERVRRARQLVFELLASSVDLELADQDTHRWMAAYGVDGSRFGVEAETVEQPPKIDNDLYMRAYSRCILCYKCVEACGEDAQNTFAIAVAGRGFEAHISTEFDVGLSNSACVFCGNCVAVCPTGALMFRSEFELREAGIWDESSQSVTRTVCSFCGVGCNLDLHVQSNRIVKVLSPLDHSVTEGNLCVKGRFGYDYVQSLPDDLATTPVDEVLLSIRRR